jgi:hypothetical protein
MAAATIISRTVSAVVDKRIVLSNGQFARKLSIGSNWTRLRLGIRFGMTDLGVAPTGTPRFAAGFCSGLSNLFGDATTDNWVGIISNTATWAYAAADHYGSVVFGAAKRVGSTLTVGSNAAGSVSIGAVSASTGVQRALFFVDITKGSPNYTVQAFTAGGTPPDSTIAQFLAQLESSTPSLSGYTWNTSTTIAADESTGGFDSINVSWDRSSFNAEISDVGVCRFS